MGHSPPTRARIFNKGDTAQNKKIARTSFGRHYVAPLHKLPSNTLMPPSIPLCAPVGVTFVPLPFLNCVATTTRRENNIVPLWIGATVIIMFIVFDFERFRAKNHEIE